MGEKGNLADVRPVGGHVPVTPPTPPTQGGGGGGLLSDLADQAKDKVTDVGLGGEGLGIIRRDEDDESS